MASLADVRAAVAEYERRQRREPVLGDGVDFCCLCVQPQSLSSHQRSLLHVCMVREVNFFQALQLRRGLTQRDIITPMGHTPPRMRQRQGHRRRA